MKSRNSLKNTQDEFGEAKFLVISVQVLGGVSNKINDKRYDLTLEIYNVLSSTACNGKIMKNEKDIFKTNNNKNDFNYTGIGDKSPRRRTFFTITLPKLVNHIQNKIFDENINNRDNLQVEGVKIILPSNIIDIYTGLEILLRLKLVSHTDTLTEGSNIIHDLDKRSGIRNEHQNRNAPNKFHTQ